MAWNCECDTCSLFRDSAPWPDGAHWAELRVLKHVAQVQPTLANTTIDFDANQIFLWTEAGEVLPYAFRCRLCHRCFSTQHAFAWTLTVPAHVEAPSMVAQCEVCTVLELLRLRWSEDGQVKVQEAEPDDGNFCPATVASALRACESDGVWLLGVEIMPADDDSMPTLR